MSKEEILEIARTKPTQRSADSIKEKLEAAAEEKGRLDAFYRRIQLKNTRLRQMPEDHRKAMTSVRMLDERCGDDQAIRRSSLRVGYLLEDATLENDETDIHLAMFFQDSVRDFHVERAKELAEETVLEDDEEEKYAALFDQLSEEGSTRQENKTKKNLQP